MSRPPDPAPWKEEDMSPKDRLLRHAAHTGIRKHPVLPSPPPLPDEETEPMIQRTFLFDDDLEDPVDTTLTDRLAIARAELPHLRLGQLVVNAVQDSNGRRRGYDDTVQRLFYASDEELVALVERYVNLADKA